MKNNLLLYLVLVFQIGNLQAQEDDAALREFANKKIPESICCGMASFNSELIGLNDVADHSKGMNILYDSITSSRFKLSFKWPYAKDIDTVSLFLDLPEDGTQYDAKVTMITVRFRSLAQRSLYLKKLGKAALPNSRWDLYLNKQECKGVQIYTEGTRSVRINLVTNCGGG